jgi:hypothetical protein
MEKNQTAVRALLAANPQLTDYQIAAGGPVAQGLCTRSKVQSRTINVRFGQITDTSLAHLAIYGADVLRQRLMAASKDETTTQAEYDAAVSKLEGQLRGEVDWAAERKAGPGREAKAGEPGFSAERAGLAALVNALIKKDGKKVKDVDVGEYIKAASTHPKLPDFVAQQAAIHAAALSVDLGDL